MFGYSEQLAIAAQRAAIALAFRMWSEVIPRIFIEDIRPRARNVDITLGFGRSKGFFSSILTNITIYAVVIRQSPY